MVDEMNHEKRGGTESQLTHGKKIAANYDNEICEEKEDTYRWSPSGSWYMDYANFSGFGWILCLACIGPGSLQAIITSGARESYYGTWMLIWGSLLLINVQCLSVRLAFYAQTTLAEVQAVNNEHNLRILNWFIAELSVWIADIPCVVAVSIGFKICFGCSYTFGVLLSFLPTLYFLEEISDISHLRIVCIVLIIIHTLLFFLWVETSYNWIDCKEVVNDWFSGFYNSEQNSLFSVVTVMGSTIMPHNVYLHMAHSMNKPVKRTRRIVKDAVTSASYDILIPIAVAYLIKMMMLSIASETTYDGDHEPGLTNLYTFFEGRFKKIGRGLWGLILLVVGQSSVLSIIFAGQYIMDGFLNKRLPTWKRAMVTRFTTIIVCLIPAASSLEGEGLNSLVDSANATLFFLFPFVLTPLVKYNCSKAYMGRLACKPFDVFTLYAFALFVWFLSAFTLSCPGSGMFGFVWTMEGKMLPSSSKFWLILFQLLLQSFSLWWQLNCIFSPILTPMKPLVEERQYKEREFALYFDDPDTALYFDDPDTTPAFANQDLFT